MSAAKILVFAASLRTGSFNRLLADLASACESWGLR
jgi:NAD(P)H-dependent FMN reductase